jgi:oxygen-dependent protoporphyrinogen oxidase
LIGAIAASLPNGSIQLNSVARRVTLLDGQWRIEMESDGRPELRRADGVVIATSALQAGVLASGFDAELGALLTQIEHAGSAVVTLIYRRGQIDHALDAFGFVVPAIEQRPIIAASFPSVKFPARESADLTPIRVFLGGALHPEMLDCNEGQLIEIASQQLTPILSIHGTPVDADVARWPASMPQYHVGHVQRIAAIERRLRQWRHIEIAGNSYWGVGIPQCIHSGYEAAERLVRQLSNGKSPSRRSIDDSPTA